MYCGEAATGYQPMAVACLACAWGLNASSGGSGYIIMEKQVPTWIFGPRPLPGALQTAIEAPNMG